MIRAMLSNSVLLFAGVSVGVITIAVSSAVVLLTIITIVSILMLRRYYQHRLQADITVLHGINIGDRTPPPPYEPDHIYDEIMSISENHVLKTGGGLGDANEDSDTKIVEELEVILPCPQKLPAFFSEVCVNIDGSETMLPGAFELCQRAQSEVETFKDTPGYKRVQYDEATMQLIAGVIQPYEQISGYERVQYDEKATQLLKGMPGVVCADDQSQETEQICGYERMKYDGDTTDLLRRMPGVFCADDFRDEQDNASGYEKVQCDEAMKLPGVINNGDIQISCGERDTAGSVSSTSGMCANESIMEGKVTLSISE